MASGSLKSLSSNRKLCVPPPLFGHKRQDNIFLRHTRRQEIERNTIFCAIPLYPKFAVGKINVYEYKMNLTIPAPTYRYQKITISLFIKNRFTFQIAMSIGNGGIFAKHGFHNSSIAL